MDAITWKVGMFLGAYWSQRSETRDAAAARLSRFLFTIANTNDAFATWFAKRRTRAAATTPLGLSPAELATQMKPNRRDVDGSLIPELGFEFGAWNGSAASCSASMCGDGLVPNSVVLSFDSAATSLTLEEWRQLLEAAIDAFDPDHAVVTSNAMLTRSGAVKPWQTGVLTYDRGGPIAEHRH